MIIRSTELRKLIRRTIREAFNKSGYFKGNRPLPSDRAFMQRGARDLGVVHAGPMSSKKKLSGDGLSPEEELRFALTKIPFQQHGDSYIRPVKDTIEKFGVDPDDEYAWFEWYQQTEGGMNPWFVKNRLADYTDGVIPSQWPKKWLKYPGEPEEGFYSE